MKMPKPSMAQIKPIVEQALNEDIGTGDVTTNAIIPEDAICRGRLLVKEKGIIAGLQIAGISFSLLDQSVKFRSIVQDGTQVNKGEIVAEMEGPARAVLTGERTALNFLQRMSGIATQTRRLVDAIQGTSAVILDTRKTAPGLRALDKWAVHLGGGQNHRTGLFDMVLIKENHITLAGSISEAVSRVRKKAQRTLTVEIEVKNLNELQEALELEVDRILLDNMSGDQMREAVRITRHKIPLEASGNVTLENVREIAETGVDFISVGSLTHSVKALDISLLFQ